MTPPLILKKSALLAVVLLLQSIIPAVVAVGVLYAFTVMYHVPFDSTYIGLAIVVAILALVLLQPTNGAFGGLPSQKRMPVVVILSVRWMVLLGVLFAVGYATKFSETYSRRVVLTWAITAPTALTMIMLTLQSAVRRLLFSPSNRRSVIFAGYNTLSRSLAQRLDEHPEFGMRVEGFFDDRSPDRLGIQSATGLLGRLPDVCTFMKTHAIDVIFIVLPIRHVKRVMDLLDNLTDTTASIYFVPDIFVFDLIQAKVSDIRGIPVVSMCETPFHGYGAIVKRATDVLLTSSILLIAAPLMLIIALLVKMSSPGPVIFKQRRYGLDGSEIYVYKFRSMTVTEDNHEVRQATKSDARITKVGRLLRRYSLDELPQFFNVLQGTMSLVGPRPHAVAHNEQYRKLIKGYMFRHKVPPGITGLAQVNGCRGETSQIEEMQARVNYDLEYLRRWTPLLDLKIIALTVFRLFRDEKAY